MVTPSAKSNYDSDDSKNVMLLNPCCLPVTVPLYLSISASRNYAERLIRLLFVSKLIDGVKRRHLSHHPDSGGANHIPVTARGKPVLAHLYCARIPAVVSSCSMVTVDGLLNS